MGSGSIDLPKPRGDSQVKIWLEDVNAEKMMRFLSSISQHTVKIEEIKLLALDEVGIINATIILENKI